MQDVQPANPAVTEPFEIIGWKNAAAGKKQAWFQYYLPLKIPKAKRLATIGILTSSANCLLSHHFDNLLKFIITELTEKYCWICIILWWSKHLELGESVKKENSCLPKVYLCSESTWFREILGQDTAVPENWSILLWTLSKHAHYFRRGELCSLLFAAAVHFWVLFYESFFWKTDKQPLSVKAFIICGPGSVCIKLTWLTFKKWINGLCFWASQLAYTGEYPDWKTVYFLQIEMIEN